MRLGRMLYIAREMISLPAVTIAMSGNAASRDIFEIYTRRHSKYKVFQNKQWGVALLRLPDVFEEYLKANELLRRKRRRSTSLGFRFDSLNPSEHLDEILSVNCSMQFRQGSSMPSDYVNIKDLQVWAEDKPLIYGVFDKSGNLKAYAHVPICGEVFIFNRLLGHGDDLDNGIMYLLISEVIREMIELKRKHGVPLWAMYDTFFGASAGIRFFKERLGFKPYKVRWSWEERS